MSPELLETTFALLRLSLDAESLDSFLNRIKEHPLSKEDWAAIYDFCKKQTIIGVVLVGVNKLPEDLRPPREILDHWICQGFYIHQQNIKMNAMCAKVTKMFADRGLRSVILKGQANARLYPDPFSRQCGDIDILVEGGKKNVIRHLKEMGLMEGADITPHHVEIDKKFFDGISVEVHFNAVLSLPIGKGRRLQNFLAKNAFSHIRGDNTEPFYEPTILFALMMQMSHIRRHFIGEAIGLRQIVDYYMLLKSSSAEIISESCENVKKFGLTSMSGALMWCLEIIFSLEKDRLLSVPNEKWGSRLIRAIVDGGNFGRYNGKKEANLAKYWLLNRKNALEKMKFDARESFGAEFSYWIKFLRNTPKRIKQRKISFRR
ncbi:nucleotidyltransferase family protein [Fibrobacter sp. UWEL]|uniref:nucleotidyltransferase family protein n=1 Tax=Fibrobacter sp. UWEL TaxID=1896209 RepID=UPI0013565A65|nr:nucleotidyltransferase family protein [Fibrobacter sp. UWEL]